MFRQGVWQLPYSLFSCWKLVAALRHPPAVRGVRRMQIIAAIALTILPGSWIMYGLPISGIGPMARLAIAIALSPAVVGLQLVILESLGVPFAISANVLVFLNLPCVFVLVRRLRAERPSRNIESWLLFTPLLGMIIAIPVLLWSLIPGLRTYEWETMLQTDVVYAIARDGVYVEEVNLAGYHLAYGWIGHSYWSLIGWLGDWAPTTIYPFTNVLWIMVTFVLSYELGKYGLGLHPTTALLGVVLMFLSTNVVGMVLLIMTGYSGWWARYFGDMRYSPFLSKFYAFDTMLWGMALLIALALVYTLALRRRVTFLDGLTFILLVGLGLTYPILFPAGLALVGCFMFLAIARLTKDLPEYTRWEIVKLGLASLLSVIVIGLYIGLTTADRDVAIFALSGRADIHFKTIRFLGAMGPFMLMAALPLIRFIRRRHGPALLLVLAALALSAVYIIIDLTQLEYKYVLAANVGLAFLAAAVLDPLFWQRPRLGAVMTTAVAAGLAAINLLLVFQAHAHIPGNLAQGVPLDESSFWIALSPSEPDAAWTGTIREKTPEDTVVIARRPGVNLSVLVGRSMYIPSDLEGGYVPGYNLNQRFYLLKQRGYPTAIYERRLGVVETLYTSENESAIIGALHELKELRRPVAIYFPRQDSYSLRWMQAQSVGRALFSDGQNIVWFIDDPGKLAFQK